MRDFDQFTGVSTMVMIDITKKWTGRCQDWSMIHAQLAVYFADRILDYAAPLDSIITVLSNLEQMWDNLSYMKTFRLLNAEEQAAIRRAQKQMNGVGSIPCTARYPTKIPIPEIFTARNQQFV